MKASVITTGVIFGLLTGAHLLRVLAEGRHLIAEPFFVLITLVSTALSVWAWIVWRRLIR